MKFTVRNITVPLMSKSAAEHDLCAIERAKKHMKRAGFDEKHFYAELCKKSVDARKKNNIVFNYSVSFTPKDDELFFYKGDTQKLLESNIVTEQERHLQITFGEKECAKAPVVVGFGPSGMFCAYILAKQGFCPIIVERGSMVEKRVADVKKYWESADLCEESNVQFGEGGAGTFSDGKLLTRINNPLCSFVIDTFYKFGAPKEILYSAKPHIGTDNLINIVKNIRNEIISLGGKFYFNTRVCGIDIGTKEKKVVLSNGETLLTDDVFLCIGHSARDTFKLLLEKDFEIVPKAFSVGVRIEHLQEDIDRALYGSAYTNSALPKGEYTLSTHVGNRAVYSFCMCPGGTVVASSSENGSIVTNGMSNSKRDGKNANSAIAVSVSESDFGKNVLSAIDFQINIEKAAFKLGGGDGSAPVCTLGTLRCSDISVPKRIIPSYTGKIRICNVAESFPSFIIDPLICAFDDFEKRISNFSCNDAVITAPETRTSSPVKILRDNETYSSTKFEGVYPCGEGAGYAGGITSAAVDGISAALAFMKKYKQR